MTYKIQQIEGIGPHFGERLSAAGVHTTQDLLDHCGSEAGRRTMATKTGLSEAQLETWVHQADLMRVSGIGSEFGQLLETAGIVTVAELGQREPENIVNLLTRVNEQKRLTRVVPSLRTVSKWVTRARELVAPAGRERMDRREMGAHSGGSAAAGGSGGMSTTSTDQSTPESPWARPPVHTERPSVNPWDRTPQKSW